MEQEVEGMIGSLRPPGDGAQECIDALQKANSLLAAQGEPAADSTETNWIALRHLFAWVLPDFRHSSDPYMCPQLLRKESKTLMTSLEKRLQKLTTIASEAVQEWRLKYRWELHRRHASEQS